MKVSIADSLFLQYGKTAKLGGGNKVVPPTHFDWELTDPETARFVTDSHLQFVEGPGKVAFLLETFFLHPENYLTALQKPFDYVLTHNSYFAKHKGWLWYPHGGSFVDFADWKVHEKSRNVSILLSPKQQLWGHKKFHEVVEKFGDKLDVYGLDGYVDKLTALAPYRFAVIVEAEQTHDFFSEKLIDCFAVGTIPIYLGCPNIDDFFDTRGIFWPENFEQISKAIDLADSYGYEMRLESVRYNLERAKQYRIPEDWIYDHYPFLFEEKS
ncbi:MAG: hypothetical protein EHM33_05950 [Chloroflexi bacterium]|nr:MAG: hypothetical protein EHM33_05950 [Chloroflexota bacterium]